MNRCLLEVLKFMPPKDILQEVSTTCSQWQKCCAFDELWWTYCEDGNIFVEDQFPTSAFRDWAQRRHLLVLVSESIVTVIATKDLSVRVFQLPTATDVDKFSAYCLISTYKVMCFGAKKHKKVFEINLKALTVKILPPMNQIRIRPGVILLQAYVYVFGGQTRSNAKFSLRKVEWEHIAQLMPEFINTLTPAYYKGRIYLASNLKVHVFHVLTEQYTTLPLTLSVDWYYGLTFIDGGELVIVQCDVLARWKVETEEFTVTSIPRVGSGYYSNCPPVWFKEKLYSLHNDVPSIKGLLVFDSAAHTLANIPFPKSDIR